MNKNTAFLPLRIVGFLITGGFMSIWIAGWSAGTLFFDCMIFGAAWKQYDSRNWIQTSGVIRKSEVDVSSDSDGTSYSLDVEYTFRVNGQERKGTRDSYTSSFVDGKDRKYARAAEIKPGSEVNVYYNPHHPEDAVLRKGMTSRDVAALGVMSIFMTPFNIVMLGSWMAAYAALSARLRRNPPHGVRVIESGTNRVIRLPHLSALSWAGLAAGGSAFVMIFVVMIAALAFNIPEASYAGWAVILAAALMACMRRAKQIGEGRFDLVVDTLRDSITVPPGDAKHEFVRFKAKELAGVTLEKEETTDSDGDVTKKWWTVLLYGDNQRARVYDKPAQDDARDFALWLARTLKTEYRESAL